MGNDLLSCPFCGGKAEIYNPFHMIGNPGQPAAYRGGVRCGACGCESKATTPPDGAINAWNRRTHASPQASATIKQSLNVAPQASEAAPFAPDWANYRQGWADGLAEGSEAIDIARTALMEISDLADVEADQRGVIVNAALTRINEITSRPALSAQPGAQKGEDHEA